MKRPIPVVPHLPGLFELERLADETVNLADQIKRTVAELRRQEESRQDRGDDAPD